MKYSFLKIVFLFSIISQITIIGFSQEKAPKWYFEGDIGYFADIHQFVKPGLSSLEGLTSNPKLEGKILHGEEISLLYGYRLKNDFSLNMRATMAKNNSWYNDPLGVYWDKEKVDTYLILSLFFNKKVIMKPKYEFSFGVGPLIRKWETSRVDYDIYEEDGTYFMELPSVYKFTMTDMGIFLSLENLYRLNKTTYWGLRMSTNIIFGIGFETFSFTPVFRCYF